MFDGGSMTMPLLTLNSSSSVFVGEVFTKRTQCRPRICPSMSLQLSSVLTKTDQSENSQEPTKILRPAIALPRTQTQTQTPISLLSQANSVGVIGGVCAFSTLIFLEKLVWWSSRNGEECIPFVVCNDPIMGRLISVHSLSSSVNGGVDGRIVENLRSKRAFLEQSGARCIVVPCHVSHLWYHEVSKGCSVHFLNVGDCVVRELKDAKLKPLEAGSSVRIGVLAPDDISVAGFYQDKLQNQGFEVVLPDRATMEHTLIPALEALKRKDMVGARNLLRIAIQVLLVKAVNKVIIASDKLLGLLPHDDPLTKNCIDPMDALARSTVKWAESTEKVHL